MAIPSQKIIRIGQPNQAQNSDSLFEAFTKAQDNFTSLFSCASPYTNFVPVGDGISIDSDANTGTVSLQNTGVTTIVAGSGIVVSGNTGAVIISAVGSSANVSGTVTSVNIGSNSFAVSGGPVTTMGTLYVDWPGNSITTTSTTRAILLSINVLTPSGYEFFVKGVNASTGHITIERMTVVSSGGYCNYNRFGQVDLGQSLGTLDAAMIGTTLKIGVTSSTTDPIVWTLQYQKI